MRMIVEMGTHDLKSDDVEIRCQVGDKCYQVHRKTEVVVCFEKGQRVVSRRA